MSRLTLNSALPDGVSAPAYAPAAHGTGILHIGLGAFHKAHPAVYTDDALAAQGGDWRIAGVSLRSTAPADELSPQDGAFTVIERSAERTTARVIGALSHAWTMRNDRAAVLAALCDPMVRIVSLTVTEKGYGIDRATGGIDTAHPAIAADLATPQEPVGVAGLLVWALGERLRLGHAPFTVLCCDNLPENGAMLRALLTDFARHTAPELVPHIAQTVAFPATMVDRITPARTEATLALAKALTGHEDRAAIETEAFRQWVIEDHFPEGRPAWEAGGALFVPDVRPYEEMKLRMLNGAHSMLAYSGFLSGKSHVRDVMADPALARLVSRHMAAAASTLAPLPGVDFTSYGAALAERFANPHLMHETYQIAMDGTEKLPQRIIAPAAEALATGKPIEPFAFAVACWMRYALGRRDDGETYALRDPREAQIAEALVGAETAAQIAAALSALPGLLPDALRTNAVWRDAVAERLERMLELGMSHAITMEVG